MLGVAGFAAGLWILKRCSPWLTIVVRVLDILWAAPGLTEAQNALLQILATGEVVAAP